MTLKINYDTNHGLNTAFFFSRCIFFIFLVIFGCCPPASALNQLQNSAFLADSAGWVVPPSPVTQENTLTSLAWSNADGNPIGSFYGAYNRGAAPPPPPPQNNFDADGILQQTFLSPNGTGRVAIRFSHKDTWLNSYDRFELTGTLRSGGVYPNEVIVSTFYTEPLSINGAPRHGVWTDSGWSAPIDVLANTNYIVRIYWDIQCDPNEQSGAYIDNFECNLSPTGVTVNEVAGNAVLNWNGSVGTVALAAANCYKIYRGDVSGGPYVLLGQSDTPTFTDASPPTGAPQYYVVTDVDVNAVESPYSPEVMCLRSPVLLGDCVYQSITNQTHPGTPVVNNQTYFPSFYIIATDSTRVNGDVTFQIREWSKTDPVTPLAVHTWTISGTFLKQRIGEWTRVGTGKFNDLFTFTSVADPTLGTFTYELRFGAGSVVDDAYMVDGVQLEKAITLPSLGKTSRPTAWAPEKGIISPSEAADMEGSKQYYTW